MRYIRAMGVNHSWPCLFYCYNYNYRFRTGLVERNDFLPYFNLHWRPTHSVKASWKQPERSSGSATVTAGVVWLCLPGSVPLDVMPPWVLSPLLVVVSVNLNWAKTMEVTSVTVEGLMDWCRWGWFSSKGNNWQCTATATHRGPIVPHAGSYWFFEARR